MPPINEGSCTLKCACLYVLGGCAAFTLAIGISESKSRDKYAGCTVVLCVIGTVLFGKAAYIVDV